MLVLMFASCKENDVVFNIEETDNRSIDLAAPVVSKLHIPLYKSMERWLDFDGMSVENGVICVKYTHTDTIKWSSDIGLEDIVIPGGWEFFLNNVKHIPGELKFSGSLNPDPSDLKTKEDGSSVAEAELSSGLVRFSFFIPSNIATCDITMTINEIRTHDDKPFTEEFTGLTPGKHNIPPIDISGYFIKAPERKIYVKFDFTVTTSDNEMPTSGIMDINFTVSDWDVYYMSGYFGKTDKHVNGEIEFDFFNDLEFEKTIGLRDIEMKAEMTNYTGLPMKIEAAKFYFANENDLNRELETQEAVEFDIPAAIEKNVQNHSIDPAKKEFTAKLKDVEFTAPNFPTKITYDLRGMTNPDGEGETDNFVLYDKDHGLAKIDAMLTIPLYMKVKAYNRTDTIPFDYNDLISDEVELSEGVQFIAAELEVDNNMPFDVELWATVIDEAGVVVENILTKQIVKAHSITKNLEIKFIQEQLEKFRQRDVKNIVLYSKSGTENGEYVKVYEDAALDIFVSVRMKSKIPSNF